MRSAFHSKNHSDDLGLLPRASGSTVRSIPPPHPADYATLLQHRAYELFSEAGQGSGPIRKDWYCAEETEYSIRLHTNHLNGCLSVVFAELQPGFHSEKTSS